MNGLTGADGATVRIDLSAEAPWYLRFCVARRQSLSRAEFRDRCVLPYVTGMWLSRAGLYRSPTSFAQIARSSLSTEQQPTIFYPSATARASRKQIAASERATGRTVAAIALARRMPDPASEIGQALYESPALLWVPNGFVVPGGVFNEQFGWDSYFIVVGLLATAERAADSSSTTYFDLDRRRQITVRGAKKDALVRRLFAIAKGMVDNHAFMIRFYGGHIPNANRALYLTRSQPPLFTAEAKAVYEFAQRHDGLISYHDTLADLFRVREPKTFAGWLAREILPTARTYYRYWRDPDFAVLGETVNPRAIRRDGLPLSLYHPNGLGPAPEVVSSSIPGNASYYPDVARYLAAFPEANPGGRFWAPTSADPLTSLTQGYYLSDRGVRASGFDLSGRYGDVGQWQSGYAPIALHALLYRMALDMNGFARQIGARPQISAAEIATYRVARDRLFWSTQGTQAPSGFFRDVWTGASPEPVAPYFYSTSLHALWAGLASREQSAAVLASARATQEVDARQLLFFLDRDGGVSPRVLTGTNVEFGCATTNVDGTERCVGSPSATPVQPAALVSGRSYGVPTSLRLTGNQWDYPNSWAPTTHFAAGAATRMGNRGLVRTIDTGWMEAVEISFADTGSIPEKFDSRDPTLTPTVTLGYSQTQLGFGWTNGVYVEALNRQDPADSG